MDTQGSGKGDWADRLSLTQDSLQREQEQKRKRIELGNSYM